MTLVRSHRPVRPTPHDALFRHVFADPLRAAELLRHFVPRRATRHIDWSSLRPVPKSFVDEALRSRCADLVFTVRVAGRSTLLFILIEHKSAPDRMTVFQVARYVVRLHERWLDQHPRTKTLPAVLFHGAVPFRGPRHLADLIDLPHALRRWRGALPDLTFELVDLRAIGARLERVRLGPAAKLPLLHLQQVRDQRPTSRLLRRWASLYRDLSAAPGGLAVVRRLVTYVAIVSRDDRRNLKAAYHDIESTTGRTHMTVAERLKREGRREGKLEGKREGRSSMLLTQLEVRFGRMSAAVLARLAAATDDDLDRWARAVLTAATLDDALA